MNAIQALSQLSYTPIGERFLYLIVLEGCICYKPGSQLSYTPIFCTAADCRCLTQVIS